MEFRYHATGDEDGVRVVKIEQDGDRYRVTVDGRAYAVEAQRPQHGVIVLNMNGRRTRAWVAHDGLQRHVALTGARTYILRRPDRGLEAAMPGQVLDVLVHVGDTVERGQTLLLLEAMKMELRMVAPFAGQVRAVRCAAGQVVERGQLLVELQAL